MNHESLNRRGQSGAAVSAQDIADIVERIHGVSGIEAGVSTAMRAIDAKLRGRDQNSSLFGVTIDKPANLITIEVCLNKSSPICCTVREIQQKVASSYSDHQRVPTVKVRIMSRI